MARWKILAQRPARPSLRVRLVAAAVCLLAAGAGIIVVAALLLEPAGQGKDLRNLVAGKIGFLKEVFHDGISFSW